MHELNLKLSEKTYCTRIEVLGKKRERKKKRECNLQ